MRDIKRFSWSELANVAAKPGVYAWYFSPQITLFDLDKTIAELKLLSSLGRSDVVGSQIQKFLELHLFQYFREDPYWAKLSGALKPSYQGELEHLVSPSDGLVERIKENPERLRLIAKVMEFSAPNFSSPIYIGLSDNLHSRIARHRSLIERFRSERGHSSAGYSDRGEAGFAKQVVNRGMPPERLFVVTCGIESMENVHTDVENILNRINYPILGRN